MTRSFTLAAIAALIASLSFGGPTFAQSSTHSMADADICALLEKAHETTCAEYADVRADITGSVAPAKVRRIPGIAVSLTGSGDSQTFTVYGQPGGQSSDTPKGSPAPAGGYDGSGTGLPGRQ